MTRILITGTPGVGKTFIASKIGERLGLEVLNLIDIVKPACEWDDALKTHVVKDVENAMRLIREFLKGKTSFVLETIAVNIVDPDLIDLCIVLRLDPRILLERLKGRGWPWCKIVENVLAETVGSVLSMAIRQFGEGKIVEIDVTGRDVNDLVDEILKAISRGGGIIGVVDWLSIVDEGFLVWLSEETSRCGLGRQ